MELSEEEKINRLLNSIAKGCDGGIADEVKAIIIRQQKEIEDQQEEIEVLKEDLDKKVKALDIAMSNPDYICKDKIRERIKHNEKQKNIIESVGKFKINDDGITGEGIEGLNDLIVYKRYEAVINELNYLLEE